MEDLKIYNPAGEEIISTFVDDDSYCLREIMGVNELLIKFSLPQFIPINEGSYCEYKAERYYMPRAVEYVKEHTQNFSYHLRLEGSISRLKSTKFKFFDALREPNQAVKAGSAFKLTFSLSVSPKDFVQLLVDNLNLKYPSDNWIVGECIDSEPVTIDFNHDFCFDVLAKLAESFNTEWEVNKNTIHIRRVEYSQESAISLSYGYNNGVLGGIKRLQYDSKRIINRVYVEGGDRNIDRSTYGNNTLLLPKNRRITHEGIEYTTDSFGAYIERVKPLAGEEDSLDVSKFYPKRVGVVSNVEKIDDKQGFYNIIDTSIPSDLDYSKRIIAGETMTIIFQTGQLAGKEFDVKYIHDSRKFEIVPIDENGLIYPQGNIVPEVGDKYAVFHMNMPDSYITNAEDEALHEAVKYLWENEQAQYSYRWTLDGIYAKRNWGEIRGLLNCGYFVSFSDPQFLPEPVNVRIVAVKELVNNPHSPEITIANNVSSKTFGSVINEIPTQEQATERKDSELKAYTKRGFRQVTETMQKLIEAGLDFDKAIKPIIVQTMSVLVGDESLQFRFVDSKAAPKEVASGIYFNKADKRLICPLNTLQHMTLGIESISSSHAPEDYKYWDVKAYQSDVLTEVDASYYLYLRCPINDYTDARYLISEEAIKMDAESGFYHFLVGIINSEDEGDRSIAELFGLTEILPGRITTNKVVSSDGQNFLDFLNNAFRIGNDDTSLDWNIVKNVLRLLNATISITNKEGKEVVRIDGNNGSGFFAGGNFYFYEDGRVGFTSSANGTAISIEPSLTAGGRIIMKNSNGIPIGEWGFTENKSNIFLRASDGKTFTSISEDVISLYGKRSRFQAHVDSRDKLQLLLEGIQEWRGTMPNVGSKGSVYVDSTTGVLKMTGNWG